MRFLITLSVEADDLSEAQDIAEALADNEDSPIIVSVDPDLPVNFGGN